jgi:8-amino-7-oxononanoate synthase
MPSSAGAARTTAISRRNDVFHVKRPPPALAFLEPAIEEARRLDLWRERPPPEPRDRPSFASNDYLGLAAQPAPAIHAGAGASRLVTGEHPEHVAVEARAADLVGQPAALAFTSGYAANVGLIAALAGRGDVVVSDARNHASIIDGARLSRAEIRVVRHLDTGAVAEALAAPRAGRAFVVTESYFSMDADQPDLRALRALCDRAGAALLVDEAHALGVLGPEGRGLCVAAGVSADALTGTFGKAFGAGGAFVAGCPQLIAWLWNRARSFVFSTGLSPVVAAAATAAIARAEAEPWRRARVLANADHFRAALLDAGVEAPGFGPIVPWVIGAPGAALRAAGALRARGLDVRAIRPPTVPEGTARIRLTVTAAHDRADLDAAAAHVGAVAREIRR